MFSVWKIAKQKYSCFWWKLLWGKNCSTTNRSAGFIPSNTQMFSELYSEFSAKIRVTHAKFFLSKREKNRKQERVHIIIKNHLGLMCSKSVWERLPNISDVFPSPADRPYFSPIPVTSSVVHLHPSLGSLCTLCLHFLMTPSIMSRSLISHVQNTVPTIFSLWLSSSHF